MGFFDGHKRDRNTAQTIEDVTQKQQEVRDTEILNMNQAEIVERAPKKVNVPEEA